MEQGGGSGRSRIVTLEPGDAAPTVFLDLDDRVAAGGEAGLLGLAFHPDYEQNGRLFVYYTAPPGPGDPGVLVSRVSEFARSASDPLTADPASERVILEEDQPADNHNGGTITFGPDGFLYIGFGDGGGGGDPFDNGQDPTTLLGALLRIDVPEGEPYGIPDDNPFAATDGPERDEIYAYGFRNPFKFSITSTGEIWVGDVGQDTWEEIDVVEAGGNYGWNEVEGPEPASRPGSSCDLSAYQAPVVCLRVRTRRQSITGGYVVETHRLRALQGAYLYGDFISGRLWAFRSRNATGPVFILDSVPNGSGGTRTPEHLVYRPRADRRTHRRRPARRGLWRDHLPAPAGERVARQPSLTPTGPRQRAAPSRAESLSRLETAIEVDVVAGRGGRPLPSTTCSGARWIAFTMDRCRRAPSPADPRRARPSRPASTSSGWRRRPTAPTLRLVRARAEGSRRRLHSRRGSHATDTPRLSPTPLGFPMTILRALAGLLIFAVGVLVLTPLDGADLSRSGAPAGAAGDITTSSGVYTCATSGCHNDVSS